MVRTVSPIAAGPIAACARPISIRAAINASTDPAHPQASVAKLDPSNASASSRASGQRRAAMIIGIIASPLTSANAGPWTKPIALSPRCSVVLIGSIRIDSRKRSPTASIWTSAISSATP